MNVKCGLDEQEEEGRRREGGGGGDEYVGGGVGVSVILVTGCPTLPQQSVAR